MLAVDKNGAAAREARVDKVERVVEGRRDVLARRVLEVELQVLKRGGVVVGAGEAGAVDNVGDALAAEEGEVLGALLRAEEQPPARRRVRVHVRRDAVVLCDHPTLRDGPREGAAAGRRRRAAAADERGRGGARAAARGDGGGGGRARRRARATISVGPPPEPGRDAAVTGGHRKRIGEAAAKARRRAARRRDGGERAALRAVSSSLPGSMESADSGPSPRARAGLRPARPGGRSRAR